MYQYTDQKLSGIIFLNSVDNPDFSSEFIDNKVKIITYGDIKAICSYNNGRIVEVKYEDKIKLEPISIDYNSNGQIIKIKTTEHFEYGTVSSRNFEYLRFEYSNNQCIKEIIKYKDVPEEVRFMSKSSSKILNIEYAYRDFLLVAFFNHFKYESNGFFAELFSQYYHKNYEVNKRLFSRELKLYQNGNINSITTTSPDERGNFHFSKRIFIYDCK